MADLDIYKFDEEVEGDKRFSFTNVKTVSPNVLMRSAQPKYNGATDADHKLETWDIGWLRSSKIATVISANRCTMQTDLAAAGITFRHFPIHDYRAPSPANLITAAALIEQTRRQGKITLIYCGAGIGRTGTFCAAWALLHHLEATGIGDSQQDLIHNCQNPSDGFDNYLHECFGVEEDVQADAIYQAVLDNAPTPIMAVPPPPIPNVAMPALVPGGNPGAGYAQFSWTDDDPPAPPGYTAPEF